MVETARIISLDTESADRWFGDLLKRTADLSGLMAQIGEDLMESSQARFDTGIGPDGVAWQPLKDGSGRTPLNDTHRMRDGIHPLSGIDWVEIRADAKQAPWHQFGTKPYVIRAKDGKSLRWPGMRTRTSKTGEEVPGFVKQVNHPGLPARPFLGFSAEDRDGIERLAVAWLELDADPSL